jgi:RNA polymerase sigma-70 factor (ECF subfamily)
VEPVDLIGEIRYVNDSDAQLMVAARTEADAFAGIFDRHFRAVFAYCARRVGESAAEDLAGEVFARAFGSRGRYDAAWDDALPWLVGIARHVVADYHRSLGRCAHALSYARELVGTIDDPAANVSNAVDAKRELPRVLATLSSLSSQDVEIVLLAAWEDLSYQDIAIALDIPVGTVRSRLSRARRRMRAQVTRRHSRTPT